METSIFVTDLARQFSISLIGSSLSGWPEQAGANFLILGLSFPHPRGHEVSKFVRHRGATTSQIRASGYPKSCAPSVLLGIGVAQVLTNRPAV
jgi:hypothetical protein